MKKNNDSICLSTCGEFSGFTGGCAEELVIGNQKTKQKNEATILWQKQTKQTIVKQKINKYNHNTLIDLGINNIDIIIIVNFKY